MKKSTKIMLIVGTVLIVLGILAYFYPITTERSYAFGLYKTTEIVCPYRDYVAPLLIIGVVLIVAGIVFDKTLFKKLKKI